MISEQIQTAVRDWRKNGYPGTTDTTERLLEYWFNEDHDLGGEEFEFWRCQREAIETLIYLKEVQNYKTTAEVREEFSQQWRFGDSTPPTLGWPKFCFKMATGSGKTFVMALAIVWSFFNNLHDEPGDYPSNFAIISPNLIVLDRLREAFENDQVFSEFPFFIPEEWGYKFNFQKVIRSEQNPSEGRSVLHITNRHQLEDHTEKEYNNPIDEALGKKPPIDSDGNEEVDLRQLLKDYDDLMILNDEAHHAHVGTNWHEAMHELAESHNNFVQLDFSATPEDADGNLFPHIIYDYPLNKAIEDGITKRPKIGILENVSGDVTTDGDFVEENQIQIETGVKMLEEKKKQLDGTGEKPVLFIMCDTTDHADEVGDFLENELGYKDKTLVIHTYKRKTRRGDLRGDVRRDELDEIREKAANIDNNKYEIIVSVLMLTEGWDVRNVTTIVPLRAYDSEILVEQTMGRGLRRMFPHQEDLTEELLIVEHPRFRDVWEREIEDRDLDIEVSPVDEQESETKVVRVDESSLEYDMELPVLNGGVTKRQPDISKLNVSELPSREFDLDKLEPPTPRLLKQDLLSGEIEDTKEIDFELTEDYTHYLGKIAVAILEGRGSRTQFPTLLPKIKEYIENEMFIQNDINPEDKDVMRALNHIPIRRHLVDVFQDRLDTISLVEQERVLTEMFELSSIEPYQTSRPVYYGNKTVFDKLPYDSDFEQEFMVYLDRQPEVKSFTKIFSSIPIKIPYHDNNENQIRTYIPDFVVKTDNNQFYLIETKGDPYDEMAEVEQKSDAAESWCEAATERTRENSKLPDQTWDYEKVVQSEFNEYKLSSVDSWLF